MSAVIKTNVTCALGFIPIESSGIFKGQSYESDNYDDDPGRSGVYDGV